MQHIVWRATVLCLVLFLSSACGASYARQAEAAGYYPEMDQVLVVESAPAGAGLAFTSNGDEFVIDATPILTAEAEGQAPTLDAPKAPEERVTRKQRIVLYSATLLVYVLEIPVAIERTKAIIDEANGWIQASTSNSISMRVPAERFDAVLLELKEIGEVGQENVIGQDVTEEYFDLEIRLQNAIEMRDRYVELLAKATTVEETLKIEAELGRVTGEIERFKGRLKYLTENARYSTITISFGERPVQPISNKHVALPIGWLGGFGLQQLYSHGYYY